MLRMHGQSSTSPVDLSQLPPAAAALIEQLQQQLQAQASEIALRLAEIVDADRKLTI